jgi:hypothetical protein
MRLSRHARGRRRYRCRSTAIRLAASLPLASQPRCQRPPAGITQNLANYLRCDAVCGDGIRTWETPNGIRNRCFCQHPPDQRSPCPAMVLMSGLRYGLSPSVFSSMLHGAMMVPTNAYLRPARALGEARGVFRDREGVGVTAARSASTWTSVSPLEQAVGWLTVPQVLMSHGRGWWRFRLQPG